MMTSTKYSLARSGNFFVPMPTSCHPVGGGRYSYTMPIPLLKLIVDAVGGERLDDELLELDFALSDLVGDDGCKAGCLNGNVYRYEFLDNRKPLNLFEEIMRHVGLTKETLRQTSPSGWLVRNH